MVKREMVDLSLSPHCGFLALLKDTAKAGTGWSRDAVGHSTQSFIFRLESYAYAKAQLIKIEDSALG